ncbi:helix-turn-helix domain-containing protein [Nostoc sp.]|uniref:helix-turn-helix domain-containing protein n=1 Tax=Nostoc sp. TaxID=1180 RepID=UPI002FF58716
MLLQLLVTLIEQFEETHYPILQGTPNSMLMHLMDARDTTNEALAEVIGSLEIALQIVNGDSPSLRDAARTETLRDRTISKTQAEALADYFNVDISLFT